MTGKFLPVQVIYEGRTYRCLPNLEFPKCFNVTYSANHWSKIKGQRSRLRNEFLKQYCTPEKACNFIFSTKTPSKNMTCKKIRMSKSRLD